ncbi:MAG: MFS transporter [Betaproteobacteria bacterium]|nr:MAG: MFS transporter [Betaproteobacteria bacterium]
MIPALRAFRSKNFRIFYAGQGLSLLGNWMQTVAMSWLVYRVTGSALLLGVTAGAQQLPILFLSPIAGVWADRVNRQRLLMLIQSLAFVQALTLALLTFAEAVRVPHLIGLALFLGIITAFETPTRQAFLLELIEHREDLPNAIALQSMLFQSTRFVGPSVAGLLLAAFGEAWCFLVNAFCYLVIIATYAVVRVKPRKLLDTGIEWWRELASGFAYAFGFTGTRRLLLLLTVLGFFTAPWSSLMPIFAAETFSGDSRTFGFLIGAVGLGAILGTFALAARSSVRGLGRVIAVATVTAGVALTGFSLSGTLWLSLTFLAIFGAGLVVTAASINTILQTVAEEDKRARIISMYVMCFLGFAPIGNFTAGALAEAIGAHWTLLACGLVVILAGSTFALGLKSWAQAVRPVYRKQGIIRTPEK